MCFRPNGATASRRRRPPRLREAPTLPPLAMLDMSKLGERQAHEFLCHVTTGRDRMWEVLALARQEDVLLCVVRWVQAARRAERFALADLSLTEPAVQWRHFESPSAARAELERRLTISTSRPYPA